LRELIIGAASEVYAQYGYHGSTVEQILRVSGVSRPTFYRYFSGRTQVLDAVIARVNDVLMEIVTRVTMPADTLEAIVDTSIDAYFEWGERIGPLVRPIYQEIYDETSPASTHRQRILRKLSELFKYRVEALGRPPLVSMVYETLLHVIEHVGHRAFWPQRESPQDIASRRHLIARILIASLALPEERQQVPSLGSLAENP
jgi:AcrR family transcriptional regulator